MIYYFIIEDLRLPYLQKKFHRLEKSLNIKAKIIVPETLVYDLDSKQNVYIIYNWHTHHYMIGNEHLILIIKLFKEAHTIPSAINKLVTYNSTVYFSDDLELLLLKLYQQGYLIEKKRKE